MLLKCKKVPCFQIARLLAIKNAFKGIKKTSMLFRQHDFFTQCVKYASLDSSAVINFKENYFKSKDSNTKKK